MKIKIACEFEVEYLGDDDDELTEAHARSAASIAAWDYLAFVEVSGYSKDSEWVKVHVDGLGPCRVRVGEDHE